ncbi:MAG: ComF family protein [Leptolyngbya sp. PLA1]|nr:ComF family protein [Leptolyngbya sp. PLA1]
MERPGARGESLDVSPKPELGAVHAIETAWLGLRRPPLHVRAAECGWSPDAPSAYCARCGSTVGAYETDAAGCTACRGVPLAWDRAVRLGAYEGLLRELIHELKFTAWRRIGRDLGTLLGESIREQAPAIDGSRVVLVPVPTTWLRRMTRGVDHSLEICRGVERVTGWRVQRVLSRRHGTSQVGLTGSRRLRNVRGAFRGNGMLAGAELVVVVDDVRTTGSTLTECCLEVRKCIPKAGEGVMVWGATLAVTAGASGEALRLEVGGM